MPQSRLQGFRLSPQQRRVLTLDTSAKRSPYQAVAYVSIEGELDLRRLRRAFADVVERHEILRTTLHQAPELKFPIQVVNDAAAPAIHNGDSQGWDFGESGTGLGSVSENELLGTFDLDSGPLLHLALKELEPGHHVLRIALPALCADTASLVHLVAAIGRSYADPSDTSEPEDRPVQYADYAEWLNGMLESEETEAGREYWSKQDLAAALGAALPFPSKPATDESFDPRLWSGSCIGAALWTKIRTAARHYGSTADTFLQACWHVLLWRLSGQREVVVATAQDGRIYEELEGQPGLFSRFVPIHCPLEEGMTLRQVMERLDRTMRELSEWQIYFSWKALAGRDERSSDYFAFCLELCEAAQSHRADDLHLALHRQYACYDRFQVKLFCRWSEEEILTELHYDGAVFDRADIERLAGYFQRLLEEAVERPRALIGALDLLSAGEQSCAWTESNGSSGASPETTLQQVFEEQVERTPDRPAVVFEDHWLSYAALDARAAQLARRLRALRVGPEKTVAVCLARSTEVMVAILGVLKAGGAYVPLNPAYPHERLLLMIADAGAAVVLTEKRLGLDLSSPGLTVLHLDREEASPKAVDPKEPTPGSHPANLAYVIYTSGSTGRPKGVAIQHSSVAHLALALRDSVYRYLAGSRRDVSLNGPLAFDTSVKQIIQLLEGHTLHVLSDELRFDPPALAGYLERRRLDVFDCTPTLLRLLMDEGQTTGFASTPLHVLIGGEAISQPLWQELVRISGPARFYNLYGPTECTVDSTACELSAAIPTLGQPLARARVHVLDRYLKPVPRGVAGELCVTGAGLGRGYLGRPAETAARFVPFPGGSDPGARLYRTGDLARRLPGSELEFLGRIDYQVKIRGFRIEPGEIEAAVERQPGVTKAVVEAREKAPGSPRLVAYVVPDLSTRPAQENLRQWLAELRDALVEELPDFMVPAAFVPLETLPRTPNGKLDRAALPEPDGSGLEPDEGFKAPRNRAEQVLADCWAETLGISRVGIHDNFFALGGDSIQSIRVVARASERGVRVTLPQFFAYQTLAELAAAAETAAEIDAEQGPVTGTAPWTPVQHWFFEQGFEDPHQWTQSMALTWRRPVDLPLVARTVARLLEHHDMLRAQFVPDSSAAHQILTAAGGDIPSVHVDFSALPAPAREGAMVVAGEALRGAVDIWRGPIVHFALLDPGEGMPGSLVITPHALVADGFSWRILLEDFERAYQQEEHGEEIALPRKTSSFKSWAEHLEAHAGSTAVEEELGFWLAEPRHRVERLPMDDPQAAPGSSRTLRATLDPQETHALVQEVPAVYQTRIDEVLLTALALSFAGWSGQDRLLVDVRSHGREGLFENLDVSRTVGWFTTIFPLLLEVPESAEPGPVLRSLKEQLRGIPTGGMGYGLLRYLHPKPAIRERLGKLPAAEVSFNYLGQFDQVLAQSSLFALTAEGNATDRGLWTSRYLVEVQGGIVDGRLQLIWKYQQGCHRRDTIERLAESFLDVLRSLFTEGRGAPRDGYVPSDFPAARLDQDELVQFLGSIQDVIEEVDE